MYVQGYLIRLVSFCRTTCVFRWRFNETSRSTVMLPPQFIASRWPRRAREIHTRHVHWAKLNPSRLVRKTNYITSVGYMVRRKNVRKVFGCAKRGMGTDDDISRTVELCEFSSKNGKENKDRMKEKLRTEYTLYCNIRETIVPLARIRRHTHNIFIHNSCASFGAAGRLHSEPRVQGVQNGITSLLVKIPLLKSKILNYF